MFTSFTAISFGIIVGFLMAIPVGPVGLIVFQRGMIKSRRLGLMTGAGAAIGDGFLASIGAFSIRIVWRFIREYSMTIRVIGGLFILITGLYAVFTKVKQETEHKDTAISLIEHFLSGLVLCISNPLAVLTFFVVFARLGPIVGIYAHGVATELVIGVVIGSMFWWIILTWLAKIVGYKIKPEHFDTINKCFGLAITLVGAAMLIGAFLK